MGFINISNINNTKILENRKLKDIDKVCSSYIDFRNPKYVEIDGIYYSSILLVNYSR